MHETGVKFQNKAKLKQYDHLKHGNIQIQKSLIH